MPNQIQTRKDFELDNLVKEITKTDKILNDFEIVLTKLRNYKDKSKSSSHVINRGIFADYVIHNKGVHKKTVIKERINR